MEKVARQFLNQISFSGFLAREPVPRIGSGDRFCWCFHSERVGRLQEKGPDPLCYGTEESGSCLSSDNSQTPLGLWFFLFAKGFACAFYASPPQPTAPDLRLANQGHRIILRNRVSVRTGNLRPTHAAVWCRGCERAARLLLRSRLRKSNLSLLLLL